METTQSNGLRNFLEIPYEQLEEMNLEGKHQRLERVDPKVVEEQRRKYLTDEKRIKAVTVCFSDLEGRFHMLDYDKKFLLKSADNLTFDGSSIRGFSAISESDLKLTVDWPAFYWLPADVFGPGKVIAFCEVQSQDGSPYAADFRSLFQRRPPETSKRSPAGQTTLPKSARPEFSRSAELASTSPGTRRAKAASAP